MKSAKTLFLISFLSLASANLFGEDLDAVSNNERLLKQVEEPFEDSDSDVETLPEITDDSEVGFAAGDSNLDGRFDGSDLASVLKSGKYENPDSGAADWSEGDWNNDSEFNSADIIKAFQENRYETEYYRPRPKDVPEPYGLSLVGMGMVFLLMAYIIVRQKNEQAPEASPGT